MTAYRCVSYIGGGAYWAGWAAAAHFLALVGKAYSLPAYFFSVQKDVQKFGQLFLWKIIKIVATRCHILRLK